MRAVVSNTNDGAIVYGAVEGHGGSDIDVNGLMIKARQHDPIVFHQACRGTVEYLCRRFSFWPKCNTGRYRLVEIDVGIPEIGVEAYQKLWVANVLEALHNFMNMFDDQMLIVANMSPAGAIEDDGPIGIEPHPLAKFFARNDVRQVMVAVELRRADAKNAAMIIAGKVQP